MNLPVVSYSSDEANTIRADLDETSRISEEYFKTETDSSQLPTSKQTEDWIFENGLQYLNIIRADNIIIGYTLILPCKLRLMNNFLRKKINEAELFEEIKKIKFEGVPKSLYLCAAVLKEKFRGQGLATVAILKSIDKITNLGKEKPILFYFKYSEEGERLVKKIADKTGLELKMRN